ncbi:MAG: META domain-containing protein, partial [Bacteroidota bacterium]
SVTLFESGSYSRTVSYQGQPHKDFADNGSFTWNDAGSVITLKSKEGPKAMYQVGEHVLFALDKEGKPFQGDLTDTYTLAKSYADPTLEDKEWELVALRGENVVFKEGEKRATITFHNQLSKVTGQNGCNAFAGSYELKPMGQIRLGDILGTLMACPDMTLSNTFDQMLGQVDNYSINDSILSLNKGKRAPLAQFKWVLEEE